MQPISNRRKITIAIVSALALFALVDLAAVPVSRVYAVEATCASLPSDDLELSAWLKTQPGIVPHSVHVTHTLTNQHQLSAVFIPVQCFWFGPAFPNLEAKAASAGYVLGDDEFTDVDR